MRFVAIAAFRRFLLAICTGKVRASSLVQIPLQRLQGRVSAGGGSSARWRFGEMGVSMGASPILATVTAREEGVGARYVPLLI